MISIEAYLVGIVILIVLFCIGLYAVYKENVLGFVASGFATITAIVFTVLAGFGRVGTISHIPTYTYQEHTVNMVTTVQGWTDITNVTDYIDSSIVYLNGFIALMMAVILLFTIGRYIALLTVLKRESEEE